MTTPATPHIVVAGARQRTRHRRVAAGAPPPLKDKCQATFQMTLLGNALLARLRASGR